MPSALLALALSYVWLPLVKVPAMLAAFALHGIAGSVRWLGGLHAADLRVPTPTGAVIIATAACVAFTMFAIRKRKWFTVSALLLLGASAAWIALFPSSPNVTPQILEMIAIDVGQGDSLLLVTPQGRTILVDARGFPYWGHSELIYGREDFGGWTWLQFLTRMQITSAVCRR